MYHTDLSYYHYRRKNKQPSHLHRALSSSPSLEPSSMSLVRNASNTPSALQHAVAPDNDTTVFNKDTKNLNAYTGNDDDGDDDDDSESSTSESLNSASDYTSSHTESLTGDNLDQSDELDPTSKPNTSSRRQSPGHDSTDELAFSKQVSLVDEKHDKVEYELERYYKDCSDLDLKRHYAIRIFNTDDTFTTLSCTPSTTVREIIPALKRKFNITSQGSYQLSLKIGKLSKILRPLAKPIIIDVNCYY